MRSGDTKIVVFTLASGESVPAEVEDDLIGLSFRPVSRAPDPGELPRSVQEALARLQPLADAVLDTLSGLTARPDQVEVQFGIKLSAAAGAVIAKAGSEANFAVKLNWKRAEPVPRKRYGKR
ncbi:MAG TPA: CU044_2847 family protein [Plasticicumulans sp.]|nr:CU044_2847 family protein [Plasticicumulans sp.]